MPFIGTRVKNIVLDEDKKRALEKSLGSGDYAAAGKSPQWLMAGFEDGASPVLPGRSPVSGCFLEVKVFGAVDAAASDRLTAAITQALQEERNCGEPRIHIAYEGIENWGWNGHNF